MKNLLLKKASALLFMGVMVINANAQFNDVLEHAKKKSNDKINNMIDNVFDKKAKIVDPKPSSLKINPSFNFIACDSVVFEDNFSTGIIGNMPVEWKTNGSGEVVKSSELTGKWLQLQSFDSYKLTKLVKYPLIFTIEFDIVAVADKIEDLSPLSFGFAKDNSVRSYIPDAYNNGAINNISITYYNKRGIIAGSSDTNYHYANNDIDLQNYPNQVMHVSIAVDGENEQVYLDKTKISDAKMFQPNRLKYFYISAPLKAERGAKILFGNYKMNACTN